MMVFIPSDATGGVYAISPLFTLFLTYYRNTVEVYHILSHIIPESAPEKDFQAK